MVIGSACTAGEVKFMLLGSGELGKEFAISAQRLGLYVIAVDRYKNVPTMHVAHESHVIDMQDAEALTELIHQVNPDYVVPEIEAITTDALLQLEQQGVHIVPCAKATKLTMDRQGIRQLAAHKLGVLTSPFAFAQNKQEYLTHAKEIGLPFVIKPVMSSSGKGQSIVRHEQEC